MDWKAIRVEIKRQVKMLLQVRLTKIKEKTQIPEIRNEREGITTNLTEILKRII